MKKDFEMEHQYISVILPTYNRKEYIMDAINSVLNQTHKELELIIVDDGSTDGTKEEIKSISDERIRYIYLEKNMGPSMARNIGIESAKYDVIAFHDSDDIWRKEKLERQLTYLKNDVGLVYCSYSIDRRSGPKNIVPSNFWDEEDLSGDMYAFLTKTNVIGTPTILVRKECIVQAGGFSTEIQSQEDWELVLRLSQITHIQHVKDVLVDARYLKTGVSSNVVAHINSFIYMMRQIKQNGMSIVDMLDKTIQTIFELDEIEEIDYWFGKIKKEFINEEDAHRLWQRCQKREKATRLRYELSRKMLESKCFKENLLNIAKDATSYAIYGVGYLGVDLINRLEDMSLNVTYIIDKDIISYKNYVVLQVEELEEYTFSKIIVTIPSQFKAIKEKIGQYSNCEVVNIEDLFCEEFK